MSYKRAIETRQEELAVLDKHLEASKEAGDEEQVENLKARIDGLKKAIKQLKKEMKHADRR